MRRASLVAVALTAGTLTTACIPSSRTTSEPLRTPSVVPAARTGGTLRIATTPPDGIDPTGVHEPAGELITRTMCDPLVAIDPVTGEPRPAIASSWTVGDGGRSLFLRIRSDARFSDGSPVTGEDVAFTLTRLATEIFASPSASLLEPVGGYPYVHGELETDNEELRRSLSGVTLVDAQTLSISLAEPRGDLFLALSHPAASPVPRARVEADPAGFARAPVCSGPYALRGVPEPGAPIVLERVEGYTGVHDVLSQGGAGYADRIQFSIHRSRELAADAVRAGRADLAILAESDRRPVPRSSRIERVPTTVTEFVGLPTTQPPFDHPAVRRALSQAVDRDRLAAIVAGDRRTAATAILAPLLAPGEPPASCLDATRFSVEDARAQLQEAGVDPASIAAPLFFNDEFANRALVTELARQWRTGLGIRITPTPMSWPELEAAARRPQGLDGLFRFAWMPPYPSAERVIAPLFTVNGIGRDNWSLYSSRDLNDALRELREAEDELGRDEQRRRAHTILCDELPMLPLLVAERTILVRDRIRSAVGVFGDRASGLPLLRELFLR